MLLTSASAAISASPMGVPTAMAAGGPTVNPFWCVVSGSEWAKYGEASQPYRFFGPETAALVPR